MTALRRRTAFGALLLALALLLFFFSTAYLLWMLLIPAVLAAVLALALHADARELTLTVETAAGTQVGRSVPVTLTAARRGHFLAAGCVTVELEVCSIMFGTTRTERVTLPLRDRAEPLKAELEVELCGETALRCVCARVWDPLGLFSVVCAPFPEVRTVCYPKPPELELVLSHDTVGAANAEGVMQNRRGSDPSETFDIREYVPGDDVRAIHWKLSCKTDTLILREASEPSHYDVVLLPDLGLMQDGKTISAAELNSAVAATVALGEQLLWQGVSFCLALPSRTGLHLCEVPGRRELHRLLPQWLGLQVPPQSGTGLSLFLSEHMEQYFTRLLVVSGGTYTQDIGGLGKRIGVTLVHTSDGAASPVYTQLSAGCSAVVLPFAQKHGERYKIVC